MTKRIVCLVLGLLMLMACFTGCSDKGDAVENVTNAASRFTTTLNMWVITEEGTSAEQAAAVNEAINKITKAKFKTKLNIKFFTEDEYYEAVEKGFKDTEEAVAAAKKAAEEARKAAEEAKKQGLTVTTTEKTTLGEETVLNEYGIAELKYPEVPDYQVDILFIGDYEKYRTYADNQWLMPLDGQLGDSALQLYYTINGIFLNAATYEGVTYAIPNNHAIGEYKYLLLNKELMTKYSYVPTQFINSSIYDNTFREFVESVYNDAGETAIPIYTENADLTVDMSMMHFWNFEYSTATQMYNLNAGEFSLLGSPFLNTAVRGTQLACENVLMNRNYMNRLSTKLFYQSQPGFLTNDPAAKCAAKIVTGGWELQQQYAEDYHVLVMESPRATDETVYNSMFGVGSRTADESRAVEILTYLNTNEELRNLLQYGIEGVNYTLETVMLDAAGNVVEEDGTEYVYANTAVEGNAYFMDVYKTGNVFKAYPNSAASVLEWEYQKKMNLDATTYPTLGFYFNTKEYKLNTQSIDIIMAVSEKLGVYIESITDAALIDPTLPTSIYQRALDSASSAVTQAEFILGLIGESDGFTFEMNGATVEVNKETLGAAIAACTVNTIDEKQGASQSLYALYLDWIEVNDLAPKTEEDESEK